MLHNSIITQTLTLRNLGKACLATSALNYH